MSPPAAERARLRRRGFWLEYASMAWMTGEAAVAIAAGIAASSIALVGFGLDSVIEFFAATVVVWHLRRHEHDRKPKAVRLIGVTFFALAAYLAVESTSDLIKQARPEQSIAGLAVTAAALLVMPSLALAKHRTGRALATAPSWPTPPKAPSAPSHPPPRCSGVGPNSSFGWWWADPAAALIIAALAVKEGIETLHDDD